MIGNFSNRFQHQLHKMHHSIASNAAELNGVIE